MHREVSVTEPKPGLTANRAEALHAVPSLVGPTPPPFGITQLRKRVEHRVDIRRDVQTEMIEVVASIDDHRHAGAKAAIKPEHELGASDAAAKSDNFGTATHRNRSLALLRIEAQARALFYRIPHTSDKSRS